MSKTFARISLHLGPDAEIRCSTYPDRSPILGLGTLNGWLALSLTGREDCDTARDLATARRLLEVVETLVQECERLHLAPFTPARKCHCKAA